MRPIDERPAEASGADGTSRFDAAPWFRWAAVGTAVLVLVQALLAGQGLYDDRDQIEVHGWVGNATFLAVAVLAGLAFAGRARRTIGRLELGLSALLLVLVIAQIGLGYSSRESADAASWHIPNGVLIFGVSAAVLALSLPRR